MAYRRLILILVGFFFFHNFVIGQQRLKIKYGDVKPQDFVKSYAIDSFAEAVVLFDKGKITINGARNGGYQMEFERHRRIHILRNTGLRKAEVEELLYIAGAEKERMTDIEGITYNLGKNKIIKTAAIPEDEFETNPSKFYTKKGLIMPDVKVGSIIEYKYKIVSPYIYNLRQLEFQQDIPVLYSELNTTIPHYFVYANFYQGFDPLYLQTIEEKMINTQYYDKKDGSQYGDWSSNLERTIFNVFVAKDQLPLKKEPFLSSINNFKCKINFQLAAITKPLEPKEMTKNWSALNKEFFTTTGYQEMFIADDAKIIELLQTIGVRDIDDQKTKVEKVVKYVRGNFKHNGLHSVYLTSKVNDILETKIGTSDEINALVIKILNTAKVPTHPLLLSTRENGYVNETYPFKENFNRMIATTKIDDKRIFLDASDEKLAVGTLAPNYHNGYTRIINEIGESTYVSPDSIIEKNLLTVKLTPKGNKLNGKVENRHANFDSYLKRKFESEEAILAGVKSKLSPDMVLVNSSFPNFDNVDDKLIHNYDFIINLPDEDSFLYIDPFVFSSYIDNQFPNEARILPIEFSYLEEDTYLFSMDIPEDYSIFESPKSVSMSVDDLGSIVFEYRVNLKPNNVSIRSKIKINKATFKADAYNFIQEQFSLISKKLSERIVLKKNKNIVKE
jgi:hypothetical protein